MWQQHLSSLGQGSHRLHWQWQVGRSDVGLHTLCLFGCERIVLWNCRENTLSVGKKKTQTGLFSFFFLKKSRRKTICCINLPHHSASTEPFLHSSFSSEDPGDGNAKPRSILPPETLISYWVPPDGDRWKRGEEEKEDKEVSR